MNTKPLGRIAVLTAITKEIDAAQERYGEFSSPHEVYGVLAEEMDELLSAIRTNLHSEARREAIQIAAVAIRFAEGLTTREVKGQV